MKELKQFFKGIKKGVENFGYTISIIINSLLLLIVYLIGAGVTKLFAKIMGKHFLAHKFSKKRETYWIDLNLEKRPTEEYYRQF